MKIRRYRSHVSGVGRYVRGFFWGLSGLLILALLSGAIYWWRLSQTFDWNTDERLTIAWASSGESEQPLAVISIVADESLVVLQLPQQLQAQVAYGYGTYAVKSWRGLAEQENNYALLSATLTDLLGSPVHNWVVSDPPACDYTVQSCINELFYSWLQGNVKSNLGWGDRLRLWWLARGLREDKVSVINAAEGSWARDVQTIDGKQVVMFDKNFIDVRVSPLLVDPIVRSENLSVGVINTIGESGLAHQVSRIINGMGAHVVLTDADNSKLDACVVRARESARNSVTVRKTVDVFHCTLDLTSIDSRYDVEVRVGKEQFIWWKGK